MSESFNSQRLGIGLSEERRIALQQSNKLKQELYAQQKKIQFSNLLERGANDLDAYIESQDNVFISGLPKSSKDREQLDLASASDDSSSRTTPANSTEDDNDGFDFFFDKSFNSSNSSSRRERFVPEFLEDAPFDPAASNQETLRDHLLEQLRLDGKYSTLSPRIRVLCEKIVDLLDANGYFKLDDDKPGAASATGIVAYPDYDEKSEKAIEEFDAMFGVTSTYEDRRRMKKALDDYFDSNVVSKFSRRLAREEFDSVVGRKTSKTERERAIKLLNELEFVKFPNDPLLILFGGRPSDEEKSEAMEALRVVQTLDPPGVGARDLRESLLLRLKPDAPRVAVLRYLISNFFDDFIKKRIGALSERSGISPSELSEIYSQPFPFYPAPEELFARNVVPNETILPEVIVEEIRPGRWSARLDDSRRNLELSPEYRKMLFSKRVDKKTKEYLRRQLLEAKALLDALRNRNSTLLRVAKAIVDFQQDYFANPFATPKPLTQQQIADKLGLDSSTVSRACNDKWLATPRGFVPFKTFFPKAVSGEVTRDDVADVIREIVSKEDKNKPLSDEVIAKVLREKYNVDVSRKTVQEHRDRLRIPNSRARKRGGAR